MQTKKILGIALAAALVGTMATVTALPASAEGDFNVSEHTLGIIGGFNEWASDVAAMTETVDGVYVGVVETVPAGSYEFKIRADGAWDYSWGVYEADYDRTQNSQTNCNVTLEADSDVVVMLDTTGDDFELWPVTFMYYDAAGNLQVEYTGADTASAYSVIGGFNGWSADAPMIDKDGIVTGYAYLKAGETEFKVRKDAGWDLSWGVYEEEFDRTQNSQTNCKVSLDAPSIVKVSLDTTDDSEDGFELWPLTISYVNADGVQNEYLGKPEPEQELSPYGIVGSMTGWGEQPDVAMYYNEDKTAVGGTVTFEPGEYEFKVRANSSWDDSWGQYEADYDRTYNSQTNIKFSCDKTTTVSVVLDMSGDDQELWPISYAYRAGGDDSELADMVYVFTGKEEEEQPSQPSEEQPSQPSEEQPSQPSEEQPSQPSEEQPSAEEPEYYESQKTDYIYFDNSQTKWDKVYAYWWNSDFTKVIDKLTGKDYPEFYTEDGAGQAFDKWYPGQEMTQIPGTDIWQARVPYGATRFIFNSGVTDEEVRAGVEAFQTVDLDFSDEANAGQIYVIDINGELKPGRGVEKTKFRHQAGEWKDYDGEYIIETFGEKPVDPSEIIVDPSEDKPSQSPTPSTPSVPSTPSTPTPATGDSTMPIALAVVAVAAMGIALVGSKRKVQD